MHKKYSFSLFVAIKFGMFVYIEFQFTLLYENRLVVDDLNFEYDAGGGHICPGDWK